MCMSRLRRKTFLKNPMVLILTLCIFLDFLKDTVFNSHNLQYWKLEKGVQEPLDPSPGGTPVKYWHKAVMINYLLNASKNQGGNWGEYKILFPGFARIKKPRWRPSSSTIGLYDFMENR